MFQKNTSARSSSSSCALSWWKATLMCSKAIASDGEPSSGWFSLFYISKVGTGTLSTDHKGSVKREGSSLLREQGGLSNNARYSAIGHIRTGRTYQHALGQSLTMVLVQAWEGPCLGIPIFGSNFWDPHQKRNSDSVFDSGDSGRKFFLNSAVENWQIKIPIPWFGIPKKNNVGTQYTSFRTRKTAAAIPTSTQNDCRHTYIYSTPVAAIPTSTQRRSPPYLHLLKTVAAIPTSTQRQSHHTYIYSTPVAAIPTSTQKKAGTCFDSWNWKNQWWERIPKRQECVLNWREHILRSEK